MLEKKRSLQYPQLLSPQDDYCYEYMITCMINTTCYFVIKKEKQTL